MRKLWDAGIGGDDEEGDEFQGRECYIFNEKLPEEQDDTRCDHCRKFMTLNCEHIEEFIDEDDEG